MVTLIDVFQTGSLDPRVPPSTTKILAATGSPGPRLPSLLSVSCARLLSALLSVVGSVQSGLAIGVRLHFIIIVVLFFYSDNSRMTDRCAVQNIS